MKKVLIALVIILLASNGYIAYMLYTNMEVIETKEVEITNFKKLVLNLKGDIDVAHDEYKELLYRIDNDFIDIMNYEKILHINSELETKIQHISSELEAKEFDFDNNNSSKECVVLSYGITHYNDEYLHLNQSEEGLVNLFGEPNHEESNGFTGTPFRQGTMSKTAYYNDFEIWYISDEFGENYRVYTIRTESELVVTFLGIKVGDPVERLIDVYPMTQDYNSGDTHIVLLDLEMNLGPIITFEILNGNVDKIIVDTYIP